MKHINFQKIYIQNFLSIGNPGVTLNFLEGINLITGINVDKDSRNGVGKSTLIESLYWCLFGETIRDLKKEQIVNNINKKNCLVSLDFHIISAESNKGGYFHYKLFGEDFYLENIGFLWVIWDFELATSIKKQYSENGFILVDDFNRIINCILPNYYIHQSYIYKGWNDIIKYENRENMKKFFELIYPILNDYNIIQDSNLSINELISLVKKIIKYFKDNKWLLTKLPSGENVINKEPFKIGKTFLKKL